MPKLYSRLLPAAAGLLLLSACGGGGGNDAAPVIVITGILEGDIVNANRTVQVNMSDDSLLARVAVDPDYQPNGAGNLLNQPTFQQQVDMNVTQLGSPGAKIFNAFAVDDAGRQTIVQINYILDVLPTVTQAGVSEGEVVTVARSLLITARDDVGVQLLLISIDGVEFARIEPNPGILEASATPTLDPAVLSAGAHTLSMSVTDSRGQTSELLVNFTT